MVTEVARGPNDLLLVVLMGVILTPGCFGEPFGVVLVNVFNVPLESCLTGDVH